VAVVFVVGWMFTLQFTKGIRRTKHALKTPRTTWLMGIDADLHRNPRSLEEGRDCVLWRRIIDTATLR